MLIITNHAKDRLKERCGLPKRAKKRTAEKALAEGMRHSECNGRLKRYVDYLFLSYNLANNIRIYGNYVYIFRYEKLITVMTLPKSFKGALKKRKQK